MATTKKTSAKSTVAKANIAVDEVQAEVTEQATSLIETFNSNIDSAQSLAKQVWFAGLGAMGRSVEEVQTRVTQSNEELRSRYMQIKDERQKLVSQLVARGEKVQDTAEMRLKESRANIETQIEEQIGAVKSRVNGFVSVIDISARLQDVSNRLEALSKDLKKSA